jgi:hypothetical protein
VSHPIRFAGAMRPSRAIRFRRPDPRPRDRRLRSQVLDSALAVFLGLALAGVLFFGLSGGFRP